MSRRILTIDDSDIAQDVIRATLTEFGFDDVVSYLDPIEALGAISTADASADLILLDIMMPEMDGIELCARIRGLETWSDVPIIMLTSRKDMESLTDAFLAGANDYVTKPFDRMELQARIRSCLRLKSEMDRRRASDRRSDEARGQGLSGSAAAGVFDLDLGLTMGRSGMTAALRALPADRIGTLGLVAFQVDGPDGVRGPETEDPAVIRKISRILGDVGIAAGDAFAHWETGTFCLASTRKSEAELVATAGRFLKAFQEASRDLPQTRAGRTVTLSAGIVPPGRAGTIATALADAIRTCIDASLSAPGSVRVLCPATEGP